MTCEMEVCYPEEADNPAFMANLKPLEVCTQSLGALEDMEKTLNDYKPITFWGAIKQIFT
jgi:hypothetical protein